MNAAELANCDTWWRGPAFLLQSENTWPVNKAFEKPIGDDELKLSVGSQKEKARLQEPRMDNETYHTFVALEEGMPFPLDPSHYSSWLKVRRIQAWVNRFIENCQRKNVDRMSGELVVDELKKAEIQLIKQT